MEKQFEDRQLFLDLCFGSHEALREIYRRYFFFAVRLADSIVGDAVWAEDVAAAAFVRLWEKRYSVREAGSGKAYLAALVRNMALTHIRNRKRSPMMVGMDRFEVGEPCDFERRLLERERTRMLVEGMKRLTDHEREVLHFVAEGRSMKSIARMRNTSLAAVHKIRSRGIGKLREFVKGSM